MLCDVNDRLGANGIHEIKTHPFFKGFDWESVRQMKSPFTPKIKDDEDCSRFDKFEEETPFYPADDPNGTGANQSGSSKKT